MAFAFYTSKLVTSFLGHAVVNRPNTDGKQEPKEYICRLMIKQRCCFGQENPVLLS